MLNTDPMMLERFGDHLQQHLRTQKTHFSYLHWGTLKCWCSAVQNTRCQHISEKCLLFHVLFLYFEGNSVKMSDVRGRSCTDLRVVTWEPVACWKTFWTQRSAFNHAAKIVLRRLSYCWEILWGAERQLYLSVPNNPLSVFLNRTSCSFLYLGLHDKPTCIAIRSSNSKSESS